MGLRVTRKWLVYLALADLSELLCHTGRRRISYSLKLRHLILDNILLSFRVCDGLTFTVFACAWHLSYLWYNNILFKNGQNVSL